MKLCRLLTTIVLFEVAFKNGQKDLTSFEFHNGPLMAFQIYYESIYDDMVRAISE